MFARHVSMNLRPDTKAEFATKLELEVIPLLRKQKGFHDELSFVSANGREAFGLSLWDNKESAEAYNRASYAEVTRILSPLIEGTPRVETYDVVNSTSHQIAARKAA